MTLAENTAALQRVLAQVNALPDGKAAERAANQTMPISEQDTADTKTDTAPEGL